MTIIAAVQMCSSDCVDTNLKVINALVHDAAQKGAKMIVLPEMFAMMGKKPEDVLKIKETYGDGIIQATLSSLANKHRIWIVGGTIPIAIPHSHQFKAACIVFDDKGHAVARYDKMHLFDVTLSPHEAYRESDTTEAGSHITVLDTPFGRLGLSVCYDIRFPALFTALRNAGAEIIAVPAAFTAKTGEAHWQLLIRARAVENFCYLIGAAQGGTHASGRKTYGHAMIIEPWGGVMAETTSLSAQIITAAVDLKKLHDLRKQIPVHAHQRASYS